MDRDRLELMQAVGRLPRNMARYRAGTEFTAIVREMLDVLEQRGIKRDILEEIHGAARRHLDASVAPSNLRRLPQRLGSERA